MQPNLQFFGHVCMYLPCALASVWFGIGELSARRRNEAGGGVYFLLCSFAYPSVHSLHLVTLTASKTNGAARSEYAAQHFLPSEHI